MKRLFALILAVMMVMTVICACGDEKDPADTKDTTPADTQAPDTKAPDTQAPETKAPETTDPLEEGDDMPKQENVPCNFDDAIDLSDDIVSDFPTIASGGGEWILGNDGTQMTNYLTEELLKEYKYFVITYEPAYCTENDRIGVMFKFTHPDGTKTECLCFDWYGYGPQPGVTGDIGTTGNTIYASEFYQMPVYGPEGVFYVETSLFLENEWFQEGDIIDQIGLTAIEDLGMMLGLEITGAFLTK